jgi:uncharacterized protein YqgV (UPF0045/DUF77 family)
MAQVHLEVLVEPFRENEPGPHVHAALTALRNAGLTPEMGPFATTADGDADLVASALGEVVRAAVDAGASSLQFRVVVHDG